MSKIVNIPEYSVSEFNKSLKEIVEENFNYLRIKGEISEIKTATKGQIYLTLKDDNSILSGVIWESKKKLIKFNPEVGVEVRVTGKITTWSRFKTTYQIDIDSLEIAGEGALLKLIEDRKKRLQKKGFFEQKYKKNIPYISERIGIITSPTGSVIHDIINRLKERFPTYVYLWPTQVQGADSVESISRAIRGFNSNLFLYKPDVIIIARGGGSTEDLMAFNDEKLAEEVFNSKIPIISAIGHETDTTIIDFVSDLRASTPTAAAEIVVPIKKQLESQLSLSFERLNYNIKNIVLIHNKNITNLSRLLKTPNNVIKNYQERFKLIISNLNKELISIKNKNINLLNLLINNLKLPESIVKDKKDRIISLEKTLVRSIKNQEINQKNKLLNLLRLIQSHSIDNNLKKGYVLLTKSKKILKRSEQINKKDSIKIKFYNKTIKVNLEKI